MKILIHSGAYITNVGNAFVQNGAKFIIESALKDKCDTFFSTAEPNSFYLDRYIEPSQPSYWEDGLQRLCRRLGIQVQNNHIVKQPEGAVPEGRVFDVMANAQYDLLVVPGMTICGEYIRVCGPSVLQAVKNGAKVLFLGAGGEFYSENEKAQFLNFLDKVRPIGIRTRDEGTYEMLKKWSPEITLGMDCAFYANDFFTPTRLRIDSYVASNFDMGKEPDFINSFANVVRTYHRAVGPAHENVFRDRLNVMISDVPSDYLIVYANAKEVHSDRVHACVVSLAYGTPVRFYYKTPRSGLFGPVNAESVANELTVLDRDHFQKIKNEQVEWTRRVIESHFNLE